MFKSVYYDQHKNKMHLWEIGPDGKTVYHNIDHEVYYYVEDKTKKSPIRDIYGTHVTKKIATSKQALRTLKDSGVKLYESDLSEEVKFLHARYEKNPEKIDFKKYKVAIIDIEIQGENEFPTPELAKYPINLITVDDYRNDKITTFGLHPYTGDNKEVKYIHCETEEILLNKFIHFFRSERFDITTGWFSADFDWPYIINRCKNINVDYAPLSPIGKVDIRKANSKTKKNVLKVSIAGLSILDSMDLYKKFSYKNQSSYTLNYIGMQEVGEGKLEYEGQINDLYKRDWDLFTDYNIADCLLVRKIENKTKFIDLAISMCIQSLIPFEKVYSTIFVIEGYMLKYMHNMGVVMNDRENDLDSEEEDETIEGGFVMTTPGFYFNMMNIDATSEYPTLVRMINISPETKTWNPSNPENYIKAHTPGLYYKKEQGIIPKIVTDIFNERKQLKELSKEAYNKGDIELFEYYDSQQLVRKILINSCYGAMCSKYFHYFDLDNASEITLGGRTVIQYIAGCINEYFSKDFIQQSKKYYPDSSLVVGDISENIVKIIDTDSVVGSSVIKTNIGDISIADIYERFSENNIEISSENFVANVHSLFTNSISEEKMLENKKINMIKKHKVKKRMYKITHGGDRVIVTEDHSIIIERGGILINCSPKNIVQGDKIIKL